MSQWIGKAIFASVLLLVAGSGAQAGHEQTPAETQPSPEAASASCVLRIAYATADLPLNRDSFEVLLRSTSVLGAAVGEVRGLTPQMLGEEVSAELWQLSELKQMENHTAITTALLRLHVIVERSVPDADAKARQLLAALCQRLEQVFAERSEEALSQRREEVARAAEQVQQAEQRLAQVQELQQKLYAEAGQAELSQAAVLADLQGWEREQQEREAKLAALHARQNALLEQIARIGQEVKARVQEDPVAIELQKVVELRERALEKTKEMTREGLAGDNEIAAGEERVALARAELAKQRQAASQAAGGSLLADLNKEVVTLAADIAESEARREYFRGRLAQARERKLLELTDRYEGEVAPQFKAAQQTVRMGLDRRLEAEEQLARCRPATVTVLGAGGEQQGQSPKR